MVSYLLKRLIATIPVMLVVAVFIFLLLRLTPGDPAAMIAGDYATEAQIAEIRENLGLDQSLASQFVIWIGNILQGDLGESYFFKKDVTELIAARIEPTLSLSIITIIFTVAIAVPMGVISAYKQGTWVDRVVMGFSVVGFSIPVFVIGFGLIYVFSLELGWFPVQGYQRLADGILPWLHHLILPALALSVIFVAFIARMTRTSVLEVLGEDYIRTARAKGQTENKVLVRHALRNAAVPIVTVIGFAFAILIGGVVVTESVFNIPGLGLLTVDAVLNRDFPTIQAVVLLFSFIYVLINLVIDLSYTILDPRIRY
ncbi:ABC transporter permease [Shimia sp. SDUM112013]|uniref:ABC transporter permease n=1 Tax=Shimia sp. SDUM112013 TaxID=3136160 RepID=UPI0032EBFC39